MLWVRVGDVDGRELESGLKEDRSTTKFNPRRLGGERDEVLVVDQVEDDW